MLTEEECVEADREFVQVLSSADLLVGDGGVCEGGRDADHTLGLMDSAVGTPPTSSGRSRTSNTARLSCFTASRQPPWPHWVTSVPKPRCRPSIRAFAGSIRYSRNTARI